MPEGHTIHRYARSHRRLLRGRTVAARSPQGRFAGGAAVLDGRVLDNVDAYGKHLFYRWAGDAANRRAARPAGTGPVVLHVHLGLFGGFASYPAADAPPPTPGCRLEMGADATILRLSGPTACELVEPDAEARIMARLGPDPLRRHADPEVAWAALRRRHTPIGAALLDQKVVAGVGNAFRAEALFVEGLDPWTPSNALPRAGFDALWATLTRMLRDGLRSGRIVTVDPAELGTTRRRLSVRDGRYVYRRAGEPCHRCGTTILVSELAVRRMYRCPRCQPPYNRQRS